MRTMTTEEITASRITRIAEEVYARGGPFAAAARAIVQRLNRDLGAEVVRPVAPRATHRSPTADAAAEARANAKLATMRAALADGKRAGRCRSPWRTHPATWPSRLGASERLRGPRQRVGIVALPNASRK